MLDADKTNHSLTRWSNAGQVPNNLTVISDIGETNIVGTVKEHDVDGTVVIVDLEGLASRLTSRAIGRADLVIVPIGASTIDALVGQEALDMIKGISAELRPELCRYQGGRRRQGPKHCSFGGFNIHTTSLADLRGKACQEPNE